MSTPTALVAGRYRLVKLLGAGGMGVVWQAWDERLHRPVALKMLRSQPELTDSEREVVTNRAMREARITAGLHHRHAVTVFDVVEHEGQPCLVMQLIESTPLSVLLREHGTLTPHETARIGAQVSSALAAAHKMRIVHRDVKPGNILITEDGSAMISDFGISHALGDATITATGMIHGTPAYLAPEVARGQDSGFASDVFSLGSTLYAMLEGTPPFGAENNAIALLHKVARGDYPAPTRAGVLAPLLRDMLSPDPKRRPDMKSVAARLSAVRKGAGSTEATGTGGHVDETGASALPTVPLGVPAAALGGAGATSAAQTQPLGATTATERLDGAAAEAPGAGGNAAATKQLDAQAADTEQSDAPTADTEQSDAPTADTEQSDAPAAQVARDDAPAAQVARDGAPTADNERPGEETAQTKRLDAAAMEPVRLADASGGPQRTAEGTAETLPFDEPTPTVTAPTVTAPTVATPTAAATSAAESTLPAATATTERLTSAPAPSSAARPMRHPSSRPLPGVREQTPRPMRRRPGALAGIALLVGILVLAAGFVFGVLRQDAGSAGSTEAGDSPTAGDSPSVETPNSAGTPTAESPGTESPDAETPAPETTQAPVTPSPSPPATDGDDESPAVGGPQRAVETITNYYALLPGDLDTAWPMMTADYQENHAGGRGGYEAFWNDVTDVAVADVSASSPDRAQATLTYSFSDGRVVQEVTAYRLVEEQGMMKIAATTVLSSAAL